MPQLTRAAFPKKVKLYEVGPRDGLQFEPFIVSTDHKIDLINKLVKAKMPAIECVNFVSTKVIPQLADSRLIGKGINRSPNTQLWVQLLLNIK